MHIECHKSFLLFFALQSAPGIVQFTPSGLPFPNICPGFYDYFDGLPNLNEKAGFLSTENLPSPMMLVYFIPLQRPQYIAGVKFYSYLVTTILSANTVFLL